jgi:hypothetical protein
MKSLQKEVGSVSNGISVTYSLEEVTQRKEYKYGHAG